MTEKPKENCAVFGIYSKYDVFEKIYYALYAMQHRGQESAGVALYNDGFENYGSKNSENEINVFKGMGLVSEVFKNNLFSGNIGIGHVRYSTTGASTIENTQPIKLNYVKGSFAIAHNGNIVNALEIKKKFLSNVTFNTSTDTEVIAQLIALFHIKKGKFIDAIKAAMNKLIGSYCLTILYKNCVYAVRDPWGFRPFVIGVNKDRDYCVASESCALDAIGFNLVRDIAPGEILLLDKNGKKTCYTFKEKTAHCMFEYVYFSRPDSVINGVSVYEVRKNLGKKLAIESPAKADMVIPVPDSGIAVAIGYSLESRIPYSEGLMKNRYAGRIFIMPDQKERDVSVRVHLNPIISEIKDKRIVLIDDSIVRGTTLKRIIQALRDNGAKEIHARIACPPIISPCLFGIDMQTSTEFIAAKKSIEEIRKEINADSLYYISIKGLIESINLNKNLCLACVNGKYPIQEKQVKLSEKFASKYNLQG